MSIIFYLLINYNKFSCDALAGFGIIGLIEMFLEFLIVFKLFGIS